MVRVRLGRRQRWRVRPEQLHLLQLRSVLLRMHLVHLPMLLVLLFLDRICWPATRQRRDRCRRRARAWVRVQRHP